jgi:ABC-type nitrate/sulfonate/bicarbonate transport system permease component
LPEKTPSKSSLEGEGMRNKLRHLFGSKIFQHLLPLITLVALVIGWQVVVDAFHVPTWFLPSPSKIVVGTGPLMKFVLKNLAWTLYEIGLGFSLSAAAGVGIAIAICYSDSVRNAVYPLLIASQPIPKVAIAPIMLIWFGYGKASVVLITFLIAFFPVVVNTVTGLTMIQPEWLILMQSLKATKWKIFLKVRLPNALPHIFVGLKLSMMLCTVGAIVGEFVGSDIGIGNLILIAAHEVETPLVFGCLASLGLLGIGLFGLVAIIERMVVPWQVTE